MSEARPATHEQINPICAHRLPIAAQAPTAPIGGTAR
jgi:hypothetical protein